MEHADVVHIASSVVRDYGLPLKLDAVSIAPAAGWTVEFRDQCRGSRVVRVQTLCDAHSSPYRLRESLKRGLEVGD